MILLLLKHHYIECSVIDVYPLKKFITCLIIYLTLAVFAHIFMLQVFFSSILCVQLDHLYIVLGVLPKRWCPTIWCLNASFLDTDGILKYMVF